MQELLEEQVFGLRTPMSWIVSLESGVGAFFWSFATVTGRHGITFLCRVIDDSGFLWFDYAASYSFDFLREDRDTTLWFHDRMTDFFLFPQTSLFNDCMERLQMNSSSFLMKKDRWFRVNHMYLPWHHCNLICPSTFPGIFVHLHSSVSDVMFRRRPSERLTVPSSNSPPSVHTSETNRWKSRLNLSRRVLYTRVVW